MNDDNKDWVTCGLKTYTANKIYTYRVGLPLMFERSDYPVCLNIKCKYGKGLPDQSAIGLLRHFESLIETLDADLTQGLRVLVVTGKGKREWTYYVKSYQSFIIALNDLLSGKPQYPLNIEYAEDLSWQYFEKISTFVHNNRGGKREFDVTDLTRTAATTPTIPPELIAAHEVQAKKIAELIFNMIQYRAPEYIAVLPNAFKHLDLHAYDKAKEQLRQFGFSKFVDAESLDFKRRFRKRIMLRFAFLDNGNSAAVIFQFVTDKNIHLARLKKILGILPKSVLTVEFETRFSNGHLVSTTNSAKPSSLEQPPEIHISRFKSDTALQDLWDAHQKCIIQFRKNYPECEVSTFSDLADIEQHTVHLNELKENYRRKLGGISRDELLTMTKEKFPYLEATIMDELARLLAA